MAEQKTISPRTKVFTVRELTAMGLGSKMTIYRNVAKENFPAPFKQGGRTLWRESTIIAHLEKLQPTK
jgi:predicted DNA-binding transcriptional regulator AlpA